jgi:hypothetical protein
MSASTSSGTHDGLTDNPREMGNDLVGDPAGVPSDPGRVGTAP